MVSLKAHPGRHHRSSNVLVVAVVTVVADLVVRSALPGHTEWTPASLNYKRASSFCATQQKKLFAFSKHLRHNPGNLSGRKAPEQIFWSKLVDLNEIMKKSREIRRKCVSMIHAPCVVHVAVLLVSLLDVEGCLRNSQMEFKLISFSKSTWALPSNSFFLYFSAAIV